MLRPPLPKIILHILLINPNNPLIPPQRTKRTGMTSLNTPLLRFNRNHPQRRRVRHHGNRFLPRSLHDGIEQRRALTPQRQHVDSILLFFHVFVLIYRAEFHATRFPRAGGSYAHALGEEGVAFPAVGAAGDYAGCCVEGVLDSCGRLCLLRGGEGLGCLGGLLEGGKLG